MITKILHIRSWNEEPNKLYPVMVWSHGGAFRLGTLMHKFNLIICPGSATDFNGMYFGEHLASIGEVIVVTYNYRLGNSLIIFPLIPFERSIRLLISPLPSSRISIQHIWKLRNPRWNRCTSMGQRQHP